MTDISDNGSEEPTSSRLEFIESENKLLLNQQNNYKELCMVLTERHVEILKYLNYLKKFIGKVISMNTEDSIGIFGTYPTDKLAYEGNIVKLDKQVQSIAESIQCSQAQISDNEENLFKEQMKLLSSTLKDVNQNINNNISTIHNYSKYRCEHGKCLAMFTSKNALDQHYRSRHSVSDSIEQIDDQSGDQFSMNFVRAKSPTHEINDEIDEMNDDPTLDDEVMFVPQMELEVLDYNSSNNSNNNNNSNSSTTFASISQISNNTSANNNTGNNEVDAGGGNNADRSNSDLRKLAACEYCGKYFNKHYLESHKRSHTGAKPFKCSVEGCNRTFTQTSSRNFHEKRFHRNFVFKCNYINCESSFDQFDELQKHLQQHQALINTVTHTISINLKDQNNSNVKVKASRGRPSRGDQGNLKHVCIHCGKSFAYKIALKQHALMHGNKNFRCPFENCNYASYWKHNLGLHLRKHHNTEYSAQQQ